jgi:hypothetical protein
MRELGSNLNIRKKGMIMEEKSRTLAVTSIMFDPPFIPGATKRPRTGILTKRFGWLRTVNDLWEFYGESLAHFSEILRPDGVLFFKCQDVVSSGKQWWSHIEIVKMAEAKGFVLEDLFILTAKSRLQDPRWKTQRHARKFHCYFLVFIKQRPRGKLARCEASH